MLRRKAHKFSLEVTGLDDEQAAQVMVLLCSVVDSFGADYESACSVPLRTLRRCYPESDWHRSSGLNRPGR
jgi:hypothetical protein